MSNHLARIADRVLSRPLLIHPSKAEVILSVIGARIGVDPPDVSGIDAAFKASRSASPAASRLVGEPVGPLNSRGQVTEEFYRLFEGVAVIPVIGSLVNRGAYIGEDSSGFTSYEGLSAQITTAVNDPNVRSIMLDIDSPGGEATGMFALAEMIRSARQVKPILALVDDMAASAGYGIASAATQISVSPTSIVGSIGVVLLHVDQSKEMEMKGRTPTLIFAGAHKVDGHPFGPLSESVRADLQREVEQFYARFVETVAIGRPHLTHDAIRQTEARTFIGADARDAGLADNVETFTQALARMVAQPRNQQMRTKMTTAPTFGTPFNPDDFMAKDAAAAAIKEARADGEKAGAQAGAVAATARIKAILECPEAEGREALARTFAIETDMTAEAAAKALAAAPVAAPKAATPPLLERATPPVSQMTEPKPTDGWDNAVAKSNALRGFKA